MTAVSSSVAVAFSGEPGSFAEDAVLRAFGEVERIGVPGFPAVFDAVARWRGVGRRRPDRERRRRHDPGDARPAPRQRPRHRRRGGRARPALPRGAARPADRGHRARLVPRPGPRAGQRLPALAAVDAGLDLQHGRRRQGHRGAGRARERRRPLPAGGGTLRAGGAGRRHRTRIRSTGRGSGSSARPETVVPGIDGRGVPPAIGRPSSSASATSPARSWRPSTRSRTAA